MGGAERVQLYALAASIGPARTEPVNRRVIYLVTNPKSRLAKRWKRQGQSTKARELRYLRVLVDFGISVSQTEVIQIGASWEWLPSMFAAKNQAYQISVTYAFFKC